MEKMKRGRKIASCDLRADDDKSVWDKFAQSLIKETLDRRGWGYAELSELLTEINMGKKILPATLNRRINRGGFSAGFFFLCMEALNIGSIDIEGKGCGETVDRSWIAD